MGGSRRIAALAVALLLVSCGPHVVLGEEAGTPLEFTSCNDNSAVTVRSLRVLGKLLPGEMFTLVGSADSTTSSETVRFHLGILMFGMELFSVTVDGCDEDLLSRYLVKSFQCPIAPGVVAGQGSAVIPSFAIAGTYTLRAKAFGDDGDQLFCINAKFKVERSGDSFLGNLLDKFEL